MWSILTVFRVYPRTHGETDPEMKKLGFGEGLSPYTRGNLLNLRSINHKKRSIPVHTGKPLADDGAEFLVRVYPRTHGETLYGAEVGKRTRGLSPYTRGNPLTSGALIALPGSIPVHTGKPHRGGNRCTHIWVYPRTHGETQRYLVRLVRVRGLSPYTRGNLELRFVFWA